jgi:cell division protein FtsL
MKSVEWKPSYRALVVTVVLLFAALFFYSSLNLKNIDYGYKKQDLLQHERTLREEIDRLLADKSMLLNLERVEKIAIENLGFQYPDSSQIIPIPEAGHEQ